MQCTPLVGESINGGAFYMTKLTREQRIEIYELRKSGYTINHICNTFGITKTNVNYLIRLIDIHGKDILRIDRNNYYSPEFKQEAINRILVNYESVNSVSIDIGLVSNSTLISWIKKYKEMGYNVTEKPRGRQKAMTSNYKSEKKYNDMSLEEKNKFNEKRIQYLEAEIECIKKLEAVVQQRKNRQLKKKQLLLMNYG